MKFYALKLLRGVLTLRLIRGSALGPLEASALGSNMLALDGKVTVVQFGH